MTNTRPKTLREIVPTYRCDQCHIFFFPDSERLYLRERSLMHKNYWTTGAVTQCGPVRDMLAGRVEAVPWCGVCEQVVSREEDVDQDPTTGEDICGCGEPLQLAALVLLGEEVNDDS